MARRGRTSLLFVLLLLPVAPLLAQPTATPTPSHTTGLSVIKTCPTFAAPGSSIMCSFTIQNQDVTHGVVNLGATSTVPFPGGSSASVACNQKGMAVTSLGPNGSLTDTCGGAILETAPDCGSADTFLVDQINAVGQDAGDPSLVVQG